MKTRMQQDIYLRVMRVILVFLSTLFLVLLSNSQSYAANNLFLKSISSQLTNDNAVEIKLFFNQSPIKPKAFVLHNPSRVIFDFEQTMLGTTPTKSINKNNVQRMVLKESGNKLRAMVYLKEFAGYTTRVEGSSVVLRLESPRVQQAQAHTQVRSQATASHDPFDTPAVRVKNTHIPKPAPVQNNVPVQKPAQVQKPLSATKPSPTQNVPQHVPARHQTPQTKAHAPIIPSPTPVHTSTTPVWNNMQPKPAASTTKPKPVTTAKPPANIQRVNNQRQLRKLDFRRDANGNAKVIIDLPSVHTKVKDQRTGSTIYLLMEDVDVPSNLRKRLDVLDFATPVNYVEASQKDRGAKISIFTNGNVKYETEREGSRYIVNVIKKKPKLIQKKKKVFKGEKLSLTFQDIEVRSVLQLLADFTDKNIVVSDTVEGSITLRLKDVPWDQALDIVLETKNLAMRENGNVIWVAPAKELADKEQQELEARKRKDDLEQLITEYISINFAKASDLANLIQESKGEKAHSLLSARGSVSLDERTNTLLVQDTPARVKEIRKLVEALDVPVQQVLIESRIVVANDEFSKDLGARFGVTPVIGNSNGIIGASGNSLATDTMINSAASNLASGSPYPVAIPSLGDRLNVNLPVSSASAGSFGFSILAKDFLLDLELSALQAESQGEVIATPRVITSNQSKAIIEQGVEIPYETVSDKGTNVQFKKAVLKLEVTPQITPDEHIVMELNVHQDTRGSDVGNVPSINTRQVHTNVLVENGQTIVLGGVHEETNFDQTTKVPVLGDLPVVGQLFRQTVKEDNRRELLIFVTPKIVDEF
jgi:type IV pilus assembly protein PilQ